MTKDSYLFHYDDLDIFDDMTDEEIGRVFRDVITYARNGSEPVYKDRFMKNCFRMLARRHDADTRAYEDRCRQNAVNGSKGGRPKKANGIDENRTVTEKTERFSEKPKKADMDIDMDMDMDMDIDMDTDIISAPAGASPLPYTLTQEVKKKVIEEGGLSELATTTWINPASLKQLDKDIYILTRQKKTAEYIRGKYGGYFANAIRAVMPDFAGSIRYATGG